VIKETKEIKVKEVRWETLETLVRKGYRVRKEIKETEVKKGKKE
jgi:hypothetical protein